MIVLTVKNPGVTKTSKAGTPYIVQKAVGQFLDRDGNKEETGRIVEFMTDKSYEAGEYTIDPRSFGVGMYDKLEIKRLVLSPSGAGASQPYPKK